jgi:hypothetical protein
MTGRNGAEITRLMLQVERGKMTLSTLCELVSSLRVDLATQAEELRAAIKKERQKKAATSR